MTRSGGRLQIPATQRKAAPRRSAEARGAFSTAAGWRARLRGWGLWEAKHPRASKGHPEWVGGKPPAAVGGCRWLGGCRGCVVPRRPTMSAAGWRARPRGWGHAGRQMWGALQGQGGGAGHHKAIICKNYVKLLAIYEARHNYDYGLMMPCPCEAKAGLLCRGRVGAHRAPAADRREASGARCAWEAKTWEAREGMMARRGGTTMPLVTTMW